MKLSNAAQYFDTCPVYDAYTGALLFRVQTSTFLESASEGSTSAKRVISVAPGKTFPAHSAVLALGQILLVGAVANPDEWGGDTLRSTYWTKRATDDFRVLTPGQAALEASGVRAFGQKEWLREAINTHTDSNLDPQYTVYLSHSIAPTVGYFLRSVNTLYRVRNAQLDLGGFRACICDEVDEGVIGVKLTSASAYNPISDTFTPTLITTTGVVLDYSKAFTKKTEADFKPVPGDVCLVLAKVAVGSVAPAAELTIESSVSYSGKWRVLNVLDENDSWNLHIRRA